MRYVEIEIGGKMRKLRYEFNCVADLEQMAGAGLGTLLSGERMGYATIRLLVWGGLKWQDKGLTIERTGAMLQKYMESGGNLATLADAINNALVAGGVLGKTETNEGNEQAETEN